MICAYCGKEAKGTKEHIISSGILGLFPECFATIDGERNVIHQGDPMVKDVCADCNGNAVGASVPIDISMLDTVDDRCGCIK